MSDLISIRVTQGLKQYLRLIMLHVIYNVKDIESIHRNKRFIK